MSGNTAKFKLEHSSPWWVHSVCVAATAAMGFAIYVLLVQPTAQSRDAARQESQRLDRLLVSASATQHKEQRLQNAVANLTQRQQELEQRIPATPREAVYLALVTETANAVGLTIDNYQPGGVTRREHFSEMELRLSAEGSFAAICQFVADIEKSPRLTAIQHMSIQGRVTGDRYPVQMTLVLYFGVNRPSAKETPRG